MSRRPLSPTSPQAIVRLALIGVLVALAAGAFAFTAGWLSPHRLTPARMVEALAQRGGDPRGHRRNHAKGVCFTGVFEANGAAASLSTAPMLAAGRYPVIGRFAIAIGDPRAADITGRVKSMALLIRSPDGQEWRTGMNAMPVFAVATPRDFYALTRAQDLDPRTGKPDPAAMARYAAAHPELKAFADWAKTAPWTGSFADQTYNSLNAFRFIGPDGQSHLVRWSMRATTPLAPASKAQLAALGPDYLQADLSRRLAQGPLRWTLMVTLAEPGDPSADATRAWPADRPQVSAGVLEVDQAQDEANGPCRDLNYDPTILPAGIAVSDDPLLAARSAAYARSFDLRTGETGAYPHTAGPGAGQ